MNNLFSEKRYEIPYEISPGTYKTYDFECSKIQFKAIRIAYLVYKLIDRLSKPSCNCNQCTYAWNLYKKN